MALTSANTSLVRKLWERELITEILRDMWFKKFVSTGSDNIVQIKTELKKEKGDKINFGLRMKLSGSGVDGDGERAGNEEALVVYEDSVSIDQKWNGVLLKGKMEEQKAAYNMRSEAKPALKEWWQEILDEYLIRFLSGDSSLTFANTGTVPTAAAQIFAGSKAKATITTSDLFDVDCIKRAKEAAEMASPTVPPIMINGGPHYVMILHPYQVFDLQKDSEYLQAVREGHIRGEKNPIFSGALTEYDGVILHKHKECLTFTDYGSTGDLPAARAILCGRQAALFAKGSEGPEWHEELVDRGNRYSIGGDMLFGIKKAVFNTKDYAVIACDSYATSH